jgi:quercetin dioxygenase-like cupin family protein
MKLASLLAALLAVAPIASPSPQPLLLAADQGEVRARLPRPGVNVKRLPTFIIKVDAKNGGSSDLVMLTEDLLPGAVIPWHRHLHEDEIVYTENGTVFAQVADRSAVLGAHSTIFIPRTTWVTIRNNGSATVRLVAIFNRRGFEEFLRCVSVPVGQPTHALTQEQVNECYRLGDAEHR